MSTRLPLGFYWAESGVNIRCHIIRLEFIAHFKIRIRQNQNWRFGFVFGFHVLRFLDSTSDSHSIELNFKIRVKIRIRCFMIFRFDSWFVFDDVQFSDSDSDSYSSKSNFQIRIRIRIRAFMNSRFVFGFDPNPNHTSFCDSRIIWFDGHWGFVCHFLKFLRSSRESAKSDEFPYGRKAES